MRVARSIDFSLDNSLWFISAIEVLSEVADAEARLSVGTKVFIAMVLEQVLGASE